jgi:hypothetical protein
MYVETVFIFQINRDRAGDKLKAKPLHELLLSSKVGYLQNKMAKDDIRYIR